MTRRSVFIDPDEERVPHLEEAFGAVLRSYRRARQMTQEELSMQSNIERGHVSRLERGVRSPSLRTFFLLAQVLEVSPTDFLHDVETTWKRMNRPKRK